MATALKTPVTRKTAATVHEKSRDREVVITLTPPDRVIVRTSGLRKGYSIRADVLYWHLARMGMHEG